jgi:hypothetical protein
MGSPTDGQSRLPQARWRGMNENDMDGTGRQTAERSGRVEIRCTGCGYGGVVTRLPDRCPMCGTRRWHRIRSTLLRSDGPPHLGDLDHSSRAAGHL